MLATLPVHDVCTAARNVENHTMPKTPTGARKRELTLMASSDDSGDEWEIIRDAQRGRWGAKLQIIRVHENAILHYLSTRSVPVQDRQDVSQNVFVKFLGRDVRKHTNDLPLRAILLRMTRDVLSEHMRQYRRLARLRDTLRSALWRLPRLDFGSYFDAPNSFAPNSIDYFVREKFPAALDLLSPLHQEVVELYFFHDLKPREIAAVLKKKVKTVDKRLQRAKKQLRKHFED